jgi:kynurenine formamidase
MHIIDISGPIYNGMWNFSEPLKSLLKDFHLDAIQVQYGGEQYALEVFENMKAQTGTYLESPGRYVKGNPYTVAEIPISNLFMIDAYLLFISYEELREQDGKRFVSVQDLQKAETKMIPEGSALLVGTGYGRYWNREDFFRRSWFFKREAMEYLVEKKPFLLGTDSAEWENAEHPEGIFSIFFPEEILILAPCVNLEKINRFSVKLTVLPLKVLDAFICPVRAVVTY